MLIINDWLSPTEGSWGGYIHRLIELEGLSLFAVTEDGYKQLLEEAHFKDVEVTNVSDKYAQFNEGIVRDLSTSEKSQNYIDSLGKASYLEAVEGYESIAKAMRSGELLVIQFNAQKK